MTTIVELPNEPKFTIKSVATQTGIRPVTLRAWERRHEILTPFRADNHYRLYSERDIAILRWLKYRVDAGIPIGSAVSELRSMTSNSVWPEAIPQVPQHTPGTPASATPVQFARQLAQALLQHDENAAGDLLREVHAQFDLLTVCMQVLVPAIQQIDEAWYRGEIQVRLDRFAQSYLRGKLLSLLQVYPARHAAPLILIGCAPMELRELNGLMLAVLLRSEGYRVEYLGPDISIEDLADYSVYEMPAVVVLTANTEYSAREMRRMQEMLRKVRSLPAFAYSGQAFDEQPALRKAIPGVYLGETLESAVDQVKGLLKARQKR